MINGCKSDEWILSIHGFIDITRNRGISRTACKDVFDDVWKGAKYISSRICSAIDGQ